MSYARFGEDGSDVYVFPCSDGIECCSCALDAFLGSLTGRVSGHRWTAEGDTFHQQIVYTLAHLSMHERAGHVVPNRAWDTLHYELIHGFDAEKED